MRTILSENQFAGVKTKKYFLSNVKKLISKYQINNNIISIIRVTNSNINDSSHLILNTNDSSHSE